MASSAERRDDGPGRHRLTRSDVAHAALRLVDRDGLGALTMRNLAADLGIGTMTLYGHVRTKEELLGALLDAAAEELAPPQATGTWRERARVHAQAARASFLRHPSLVVLRAQRPLLQASQFRVTEEVVSAMLEAGFSRAEAAAGFRALFTYVFGSALVETPADGQEQARRALAALPRDAFPAYTSMVDEAVATMEGDEQFEIGLDALLDGLEARLRAR